MFEFGFCLKEGARSALRSAAIPLFLIIAIGFVVTYSVAYPSYLSLKERATEYPPWAAEFQFSDRSRVEADELAERLSAIFDGATIIDSCNSQAFISADRGVLSNAFGMSPELGAALLLNQPDRSVFPIDVYVPDGFVVKGDPRSGNGFLIDARTAQRLGVDVGDKLYVGLLYPKGSPESQSVPLPDGYRGGSDEPAEDIVFTEQTISAIVMPSSYLEGIAMFQPAESVQAYEQEGGASCTQLFLMGRTQDQTIDGWSRVENDPSMEDVYFLSASEEVQWHSDVYAQDLGGVRVFRIAIVAGCVAVLFVLMFDAIRRQTIQLRSLIVLLSLGSEKRALLRGYGLSALVLYGAIVALGCMAGFWLSGVAYPVWVPPELKQMVIAIACFVLLACCLLQYCVLRFRLSRVNVYDMLAEERG